MQAVERSLDQKDVFGDCQKGTKAFEKSQGTNENSCQQGRSLCKLSDSGSLGEVTQLPFGNQIVVAQMSRVP
jgi:hypothetical protein